ncbi:MAG: GGDEF domain-containing protein [Actinobacteria bacterium]|nr:GGDEF domain-containing protein [Actinomycetota bacterium]
MKAGQASNVDTGISPRVRWMVVGNIWLVLGLVQLASYVFRLTPEPLPPLLVALTGVLPLVLSGIWFVCARAEVEDIRWFHAPLALGLVLLVTGSVIDPNDHSADVAYPMLPMIVGLVMFPFRHAWPYVIGAVLGSCAFVIYGDDPTPWPRAIVTAVVVLSTAGLLTLGQQQLRNALRRNQELSEIDALTGVANVRRLRLRLATEIARARGDADFALLALDLDDFKAVNDTLGHSTGDRVLVEVARAIEANLRPGEMVARRGGDEFTVILFPRDQQSAERARDAIVAAIRETRSDLCPSIEPGASIGLVWHKHGESLGTLLERADGALHDEKTDSHLRRGGARSGGHLAIAEEDATPGEQLLSGASENVVRPWREMHARASWRMIAGVYAAFAAIVPLLGLADPSSEILNAPVYATCLASGILSALCLIPTEYGGHRLRRAALAGAIAVAAILVIFSGNVRNATIDLLVLPSMLAFYVAGRRGGAVFALVGMGTFTYFMSTIDYDLTMIRTVQTAVVVVLVGHLVPHAMKQTRAASNENERLAGVDPLTGLANVRRMNQRLSDELDRARSLGGYVTVFMIDLDEFKLVNDTFSHQVGDETLVAVANAIDRSVRDGDLVARRGGDEFLAIVPHDGEVEPDEVAARIEYEVCAARQSICPELNPDVSVGWVTGRPGDTAPELIGRADTSEKIVKQRHRNGGPPLRIVA